MKTLTFEELAEKLEGKIWVKENLKRIYLDKGYNTKKMSTKTYVYLTETGEYKVSCNIQCESQPWAWIKSQQDEIIEHVLSEIENTNEIYNIELVEFKINQEKEEYEVFVKENSEAATVWFTEDSFYDEFGKYPQHVFQNLPEIEKKPKSVPVFIAKPEPVKIKKTIIKDFGIGTAVNHSKFLLGEVKSENTSIVEVFFESVGLKKLMKEYCSLEIIEND